MELSIIVPIYNVEEYLEECLNSLYSIKGVHKEIILVDDGSPDESFKIIEKFKNKFPDETVVIRKENGGLSSARNYGLKVATGKYVAFIDSDDFVDTESFTRFFAEGIVGGPDVVIGNMRYFGKNKIGDPLFRSQLVKNSNLMSGQDFFNLTFQNQKCFREEVVDDLYRREFLLENDLFFEENILHEDSLFTPLVYLRASKVKYMDIPFYYYRQREGSIMNVLSEKSMESLEKICDLLVEEYNQLDDLEIKSTLSKLILSYYKVVVYKYYNANLEYKNAHKKYRKFFLKLSGFKNKNIEETLLFFSIFIPNYLRKKMGIQITNIQKIPTF
jgi:CDP-glycerol glycerophosphotransferase